MCCLSMGGVFFGFASFVGFVNFVSCVNLLMLLVSSDFQFNILGQFHVHVRLCMFFFEL